MSGGLQPYAQRIAIQCLQTFYRLVDVELRSFEFFIADNFSFKHEQPGRFQRRIIQAPYAVQIILRRQLALLALECGIWREVDAGLYMHRVGLAAIA